MEVAKLGPEISDVYSGRFDSVFTNIRRFGHRQ
jgi:hypothetical protein